MFAGSSSGRITLNTRRDKDTCVLVQACSKTSTDMTLLIDYRERRLAALLDVDHSVRNLAVGDIVCSYGGANQWIAERKTASDLAQSITSGRWRDQLHRLRQTGCRVIFLVEGDLRKTTLNMRPYKKLRRNFKYLQVTTSK